MHDATLLLAIIAVVLLAYQAEVDDRPPFHDEHWMRTHHADLTVFVFMAALVIVVAMFVWRIKGVRSLKQIQLLSQQRKENFHFHHISRKNVGRHDDCTLAKRRGMLRA